MDQLRAGIEAGPKVIPQTYPLFLTVLRTKNRSAKYRVVAWLQVASNDPEWTADVLWPMVVSGVDFKAEVLKSREDVTDYIWTTE